MTDSVQSRTGDGGRILKELGGVKGSLVYTTEQQLPTFA